jgi:hypothetical protein
VLAPQLLLYHKFPTVVDPLLEILNAVARILLKTQPGCPQRMVLKCNRAAVIYLLTVFSGVEV